MPQSAVERTQQVLADPVFRQLAMSRARLRWGLSLLTLAAFFGFIALISMARGTLAANIGGSSISIGLGLALAMILLVVVLTGIYVQQSNSRFDPLTRSLDREFGQ